MTEYRLLPATPARMEAIYQIIDGRIRWMDRVGIRQWNTTDYWGVYPKSYYCALAESGKLLVYVDREDAVVAVGALLREDPRWEDGLTTNAWYLHHFATALDKPGVGAEMLKSMETYTKACGKDYLRLDCAVDNAFLNGYYEEKGYAMRGTCVDGPYEGNLREKLL